MIGVSMPILNKEIVIDKKSKEQDIRASVG
jgi:hypothetical protein